MGCGRRRDGEKEGHVEDDDRDDDMGASSVGGWVGERRTRGRVDEIYAKAMYRRYMQTDLPVNFEARTHCSRALN